MHHLVRRCAHHPRPLGRLPFPALRRLVRDAAARTVTRITSADTPASHPGTGPGCAKRSAHHPDVVNTGHVAGEHETDETRQDAAKRTRELTLERNGRANPGIGPSLNNGEQTAWTMPHETTPKTAEGPRATTDSRQRETTTTREAQTTEQQCQRRTDPASSERSAARERTRTMQRRNIETVTERMRSSCGARSAPDVETISGACGA